jgi:hypothetical protein
MACWEGYGDLLLDDCGGIDLRIAGAGEQL